VTLLRRTGRGAVTITEGETTELTVTLGRDLVGGEAVTVPLTVTGTNITSDDYLFTLSPEEGLNNGVALNTSTNILSFTGSDTGTQRVATLIFTAKDDKDNEGDSESLKVGFGKITSNLDRESGTGTGPEGTSPSRRVGHTLHVAITITDNDFYAIDINATDTTAIEGSTSAMGAFTVALATEPTEAVVVSLYAAKGLLLSGPHQNSFNEVIGLFFNPSTYATAQTVTVRSIEDSIDSPSQRKLDVNYVSRSADSDYNSFSGIAATITVTDNDPTQVTLAGAAGDITEGGTKTFTVTLDRGLVDGETLPVPLIFGGGATRNIDYTIACPNSLPRGVTCNNLNSGSPTVTFTGTAGAATATAVTLTLTAATDDDRRAETVIIDFGTLLSASSGTGLDGGASGTNRLAAFDINDMAGLTFSPDKLTVTERGSAADRVRAYTMVLDTDPGTGNTVTVTITNDTPGAVALDTNAGMDGDQNTLTFTSGDGGNWNTPQTVTVRALNDGDAAAETVTLRHAATASGGDYKNLNGGELTVTTVDAGHGVTVTPTSVSVDEGDYTDTYTIVLHSQPGGAVVITPTPGVVGRGATATVSGPVSFNNNNWNTPQTVTVTGKAVG